MATPGQSLELLTVTQIIAFNQAALGRQPSIVLDQNALDSAVAQVGQDVFGCELYPSLPEKASVYAYLINRNHPFVDGNKRTSMISALFFLETNGRRAEPTDQEIFDLTLSIAKGTIGWDEVSREFAVWISR